MTILTPTQVATLRANILAELDPVFVGYRTNGQTPLITAWYNANSTFTAYKKRVMTSEVGQVVNYIAVEAMTAADRGRIDTFYIMNPAQFDPSRVDVRTYWANTFAGALGGQGQATRDALEVLWKRLANRVEQLFATGTGTVIAPGELVFQGNISDADINATNYNTI